jgi:GT2 family glycosyltransferase
MSSPSRLPSVAIIILNWQNAQDTIDCLSTVYRLRYANYSVLVVDNGSQDGSVEQIRTANPETPLLCMDTNLGYAEGNNRGIEQALQHQPDLLDRLVEAGEKNPDACMLGPTMYCIEPERTIYAAGSFVDWKTGNVRHRGMFKPEAQCSLPQSANPVDFITGCGVLVRSSFIKEHGALDPRFYLNYEDVEWGIRAWKKGYKVLHIPGAVLWHKVSGTMGLASPTNTYYTTRNALFFFWQHTKGVRRILVLLAILTRTLRTILAWTLRGRYQTKAFRVKRDSNLLAVRDFFSNRTGQMGPDVKKVLYG